MLTFRIIVATHRRPELLRRFLECLAPQLAQRPEFHLVVINDGSHNDAYQRVVCDFGETMTYLKLPESRGPGPARQAGLDGASEDYLVTTDDDCVPPFLWLDRLLALAMAYPHVDLFAGTTTSVDEPRGVIRSQIVHVPNASPAPVFREKSLITAVTANAMYRREIFEEIGGFAEDIRGSADDCYVTQRILRAGGCWIYVPNLVTGHRAIQSVGELRRKFRGYGFHAAQYVVREQDWRVASIPVNAASGNAMYDALVSALAQWRKSANEDAAWPARIARFISSFIAVFSYRRGWQKGSKVFAARYGRGIPAIPKLVNRYNKFCSEIVLPRNRA
jgi:GT2 family glycosyltransferase